MLNSIKNWFLETPDRALDQAYRAALTIQSIEDEYFQGQKFSADTTFYSRSVLDYFQSEIEENLKIAQRRISEFKAARSIVSNYETKSDELNFDDQFYGLEPREKSTIIIEKLNFIDQVILRYQPAKTYQEKSSVSLVKTSDNKGVESKDIKQDQKLTKSSSSQETQAYLNNKNIQKTGTTISDKAGVVPRSILRTFMKIRQEIDPESMETEEEVIKKFRRSRNRTKISIKFLLILVIVPLLVHQITKIAIVKPLVNSYFSEREPVIFVNRDLEEEALMDLERYEHNLHLKSVIGLIPELTPEKVEAEVKAEAQSIVEEYRQRSLDAIENIFSDLFSLIAFVWVLVISKKEIAILKSFIDETIYGLSDSAKAFLIILFTDIFVGYHSPHGWEVILEGIARHFGLPENREFNFLFIATFPVILDTVLKYWIFRYLNRISPSAVATYKNMNE